MLDRNGSRINVVGQEVYSLYSHRLYIVTAAVERGVETTSQDEKQEVMFFPLIEGKKTPLIAIPQGSRLKDLLTFEGMIELYQEAQLVQYRIPVVTEYTFQIEYEGGRDHYRQKELAIKTFDRAQWGYQEARAFFAECTRYNGLDKYRDSTGDLIWFTGLGGYPMFYLDKENNVLCPLCANASDKDTSEIPMNKPIIGEMNEEGELYCDQCNNKIPSAHGDDDETADEEAEKEVQA